MEGYFWYDKIEETDETILNCRVDKPTDEEIKKNYKNDYCLMTTDKKELTLDEALAIFKHEIVKEHWKEI